MCKASGRIFLMCCILLLVLLTSGCTMNFVDSKNNIREINPEKMLFVIPEPIGVDDNGCMKVITCVIYTPDGDEIKIVTNGRIFAKDGLDIEHDIEYMCPDDDDEWENPDENNDEDFENPEYQEVPTIKPKLWHKTSHSQSF